MIEYETKTAYAFEVNYTQPTDGIGVLGEPSISEIFIVESFNPELALSTISLFFANDLSNGTIESVLAMGDMRLVTSKKLKK